MSNAQGLALQQAAQQGLNVTLWQAQAGAFDGSEVLIWLLAVGTAVGGALWAGAEYQEELAYLGSKRSSAAVRFLDLHRHTFTCQQCVTGGHANEQQACYFKRGRSRLDQLALCRGQRVGNPGAPWRCSQSTRRQRWASCA